MFQKKNPAYYYYTKKLGPRQTRYMYPFFLNRRIYIDHGRFVSCRFGSLDEVLEKPVDRLQLIQEQSVGITV
jgi:hypothetical protein